jgi:hypothetical protein
MKSSIKSSIKRLLFSCIGYTKYARSYSEVRRVQFMRDMALVMMILAVLGLSVYRMNQRSKQVETRKFEAVTA